MSRDYFDDGYDFTTNRITLPNGEAVLITPSRNKHRLYIADLPDRIKRRCLTLPTDDHFLDNGCDQHKHAELPHSCDRPGAHFDVAADRSR